MTLKDILLEYKYKSSTDDIIEDFIIPCLKEAYQYDRAVGFFSSESLKLALDGIIEFIKKDDCKIRIITSPYLTNEDIASITKSLEAEHIII